MWSRWLPRNCRTPSKDSGDLILSISRYAKSGPKTPPRRPPKRQRKIEGAQCGINHSVINRIPSKPCPANPSLLPNDSNQMTFLFLCKVRTHCLLGLGWELLHKLGKILASIAEQYLWCFNYPTSDLVLQCLRLQCLYDSHEHFSGLRRHCWILSIAVSERLWPFEFM